jgi:hypothetical protein
MGRKSSDGDMSNENDDKKQGDKSMHEEDKVEISEDSEEVIVSEIKKPKYQIYENVD